jgi:NDP-sugar pyrophosphorylase family protein
MVTPFCSKTESFSYDELIVCCSALEKPYIASMGIYVMTANVLKELLENHMPTANDFGNEVIPEARKMGYPVQVGKGTAAWSSRLTSMRALAWHQLCLLAVYFSSAAVV